VFYHFQHLHDLYKVTIRRYFIKVFKKGIKRVFFLIKNYDSNFIKQLYPNNKMETTEKAFDLTKKEIADFLSKNRKKNIEDYVKEFKGDRNLRELQIGKRKDYSQGKNKIQAERIQINLQKKIVNTSAAFLLAEAPSIFPSDAKDKAGIEILKILKKNRINSKLLKFAKCVMAETQSVFIFNKDPEGTISFRNYNSDTGFFTPEYDVYGDLIAFYWEFIMPGGEDKHLWIFDQTHIYKYMGDGEYNFVEANEHGFDVIPVVFLEQQEPEWWDVRAMIDRLEMILSKLAGSNNYFAFPILKLKGGVGKNADGESESLVDQSEDGKSLLLGFAQLNNEVIQSDAEFLQRDTGVESIKLEMEYLRQYIFNISQTPDLSFDNVKGIGAVSGRALLLMMQDAINKAKDKQGDYRIVIERIINVIKSGLKSKSEDLEFNIEFNLSLPNDVSEDIRTLLEATGGKPVLSQESGVRSSPFTSDLQKEIDALKKEKAESYEGTLIVGEDE